MLPTSPLDTIALGPYCCMVAPGEMPESCMCGPAERALRAVIDGTYATSLTDDQRAWCLDEITKVEGYTREEYAGSTDTELARGVLGAWRDYCRDKGLL